MTFEDVGGIIVSQLRNGSVVELAYTRDLKSRAQLSLWVRVPSELPFSVPRSSSPWKSDTWCRPPPYGSRKLGHFSEMSEANPETGKSTHGTFEAVTPSKFGVGGTFGLLAQLAEHRPFKPRVVGSNPTQPTFKEEGEE